MYRLILETIKEITIDVSSFCNFKCSFCPNAIRNHNTKKFMDIDLFEVILDVLIKKLHFYEIHLIPTNGEIFVHPRISRILSKIIEYKNTSFIIMTNGFSIDLNELIRISSIKNLKLVLSIYGADYEEFLEITNSNVKEEDYNKFVLNFPNLLNNGVEFAFRSYKNSSGLAFGLDMKKFERMKTTFFDWRSYPNGNQKEMDDTKNYFDCWDAHKKCCAYGNTLSINPDGYLLPCSCVDYTSENYLGKFQMDTTKSLTFTKNNKNIANFLNYRKNTSENKMCANCEYPVNSIINNALCNNEVGIERNEEDFEKRIQRVVNFITGMSRLK